ncbi:MAG: hypothetical protein ABI572_12830 [Actinomycetota bacterium]
MTIQPGEVVSKVVHRPTLDPMFLETRLTLRRHRLTLEILTNLGAMPTTGGWIVVGGPLNRNGSGAPGTVFGFVP